MRLKVTLGHSRLNIISLHSRKKKRKKENLDLLNSVNFISSAWLLTAPRDVETKAIVSLSKVHSFRIPGYLTPLGGSTQHTKNQFSQSFPISGRARGSFTNSSNETGEMAIYLRPRNDS